MRDLFISKCFNGSRFLIFEIDKGNEKYFEFVALRPTGSKAHSLNQKRYFLYYLFIFRVRYSEPVLNSIIHYFENCKGAKHLEKICLEFIVQDQVSYY